MLSTEKEFERSIVCKVFCRVGRTAEARLVYARYPSRQQRPETDKRKRRILPCKTACSGVAEWARALTGDRTVNGSSSSAINFFRFASELWQFRLPRLAGVFRMRQYKRRWSLLSGVYARGSKRSHQSALECITVVDSTSHSKSPNVR